MIPIKELRIGNVVSYNDNIQTIKSINDDGDICLGMITPFGVTNNDINAVKITKKVLKTAAFLGENSRIDYCFNFKKAYMRINGDKIILNVEYIHMLQNLVFFNTGIELCTFF